MAYSPEKTRPEKSKTVWSGKRRRRKRLIEERKTEREGG